MPLANPPYDRVGRRLIQMLRKRYTISGTPGRGYDSRPGQKACPVPVKVGGRPIILQCNVGNKQRRLWHRRENLPVLI
jgi:hypothetical protein